MGSKESKKALAKKLGISRSSLYYESKMKVRDNCVREQILTVLSEHPSYGHRRLSIHLGLNKKRMLRVMKKYGIKPYRRRARRPRKPGDLGKDPMAVVNWAKAICPLARNVLWASDFTYFWFHGKWWYLATVLDVYSREIVGFSFSGRHDQEQNGFQESFYSEFKKDLGDTSRFETIGEFVEGLYLQIHYYNNDRIHTALKMPPASYAAQHSGLEYKLS